MSIGKYTFRQAICDSLRVDVSAETLQAFADNAWDAATAAANSFRPQLRYYEQGATNLFAGGSIGSVSKNSTSQSYRGPGVGSYTPVQIANSWRMLINLYDEVLGFCNRLYTLSQANPPPSPNSLPAQFIAKFPGFNDDPDEAVYFFMQRRLQPVESYQTDLTDLRLPYCLGNNGNGGFQTW